MSLSFCAISAKSYIPWHLCLEPKLGGAANPGRRRVSTRRLARLESRPQPESLPHKLRESISCMEGWKTKWHCAWSVRHGGVFNRVGARFGFSRIDATTSLAPSTIAIPRLAR